MTAAVTLASDTPGLARFLDNQMVAGAFCPWPYKGPQTPERQLARGFFMSTAKTPAPIGVGRGRGRPNEEIDMPQRTRLTHRPIHAVTGFGHVTEQISRRQALRAVGEVVYAVRVGDVIKIGHTTDMAGRFASLHADEVLAFAPGTYDDEQALHASLVQHLHHGREWYYPTPGVLAVVNEMRDRLGLEPYAA